MHSNASTKICQHQVENALHWIKNSIMVEPSFTIRPRILGTRTYDEFTTSNVESEHSIIKSKGVGVMANSKVTTMFQKTDLNAEIRSNQRTIYQEKDIMSVNVDTKCQVSKLFVTQCYKELLNRVEYSKCCFSKQTNGNNWIVIYVRKNMVETSISNHFIPIIKRKRFVTLTQGKFVRI